MNPTQSQIEKFDRIQNEMKKNTKRCGCGCSFNFKKVKHETCNKTTFCNCPECGAILFWRDD